MIRSTVNFIALLIIVGLVGYFFLPALNSLINNAQSNLPSNSNYTMLYNILDFIYNNWYWFVLIFIALLFLVYVTSYEPRDLFQ